LSAERSFSQWKGATVQAESIRTDSRQAALALLERCLDSKEYVNAGIQNADGVYAVEVSQPIDEIDDSE
jgi:hypothetical protein